jgi:predicted lipoprotein with Yx(FWY)xxD motif
MGAVRRFRRLPALAAGVAAAALLLAACDGGAGVSTVSAPPTTNPSVTISTEPSPVGPVLATGTGHTLYDFAPDTPTQSTCITSICVELWPPLLVTGTPTVGKGLRASLVGTIRRPDGTLQATYGGHPLYTWKGDSQPGMITGQALLNAGGYWYVVSPSGQQITEQFTVLGR